MQLTKRISKKSKLYQKELIAITIDEVVIIVKQQIKNNKIRTILKNDNTLKTENFEQVKTWLYKLRVM